MNKHIDHLLELTRVDRNESHHDNDYGWQAEAVVSVLHFFVYFIFGEWKGENSSRSMSKLYLLNRDHLLRPLYTTCYKG